VSVYAVVLHNVLSVLLWNCIFIVSCQLTHTLHCSSWVFRQLLITYLAQPGSAGGMFCCCFLFFLSSSYLKNYQTDLHQIGRVDSIGCCGGLGPRRIFTGVDGPGPCMMRYFSEILLWERCLIAERQWVRAGALSLALPRIFLFECPATLWQPAGCCHQGHRSYAFFLVRTHRLFLGAGSGYALDPPTFWDELFITASASNMTLTKVNYHSLNYARHWERTVA